MAKIRIVGDSSGYVELSAPNAAGNNTLELPSNATKLVGADASNSLNVTGIATFSGGIVVSAGSTSAPSISPTGDSNTGIFFPSADTIAFAEGGVERVRIDTNGNVGIGTDNVTNTSYKTLQVHSSGVNSYLVLTNSSSGADSNNDGVSFVLTGSDVNILNRESGNILLSTNGGERARVTSTGNVQIANGNLVFSTAGTGIDFSATANSGATVSSELFSDYEIGTWTPTFYLDSVLQSYDVDRQSCFYTKIGNLVYVQFWTGWGAYGQSNFPSSSSAVFEIGGLPFVEANPFRGGSMGNARTQGGTSDNLGLSILYQSDKISFTSTSGNFGSWYGSGRRAASSISGSTNVVIVGAITYVT